MTDLVIVESPTKAKTLAKFLGNKFRIEASMGHIRDLPKAELGIDTENHFEPQYIIPKDKKKRANELIKLAQNASTVWLASDPDREGEAIAWHIRELIVKAQGKAKEKGKDKQIFKRVEFHEITEEAVKSAFEHPRELNFQLVDAQQARRVLDRLVGYKLSPLLWKKVRRGLSAGRVQSVALKLIVEREKEIEAFKAIEYWSIQAEVSSTKHPLSSKESRDGSFLANLTELNGKKLEIGSETVANEHLVNLKKAEYAIKKITKREIRRTPPPPFTTSTLQQSAGNKLGMSAKKIMSLAQFLYEKGLITYMRTDSVNLAPAALNQTREMIAKKFGPNYLPEKARVFKTKSKSAQEAHEAIRPTDSAKTSHDLSSVEGVTRDHIRLYDLIWKRMVAGQMREALIDQTGVDVTAKGSHPEPSEVSRPFDYTLRASGSVIKFDGWLTLYKVATIKPEVEVENKDSESSADETKDEDKNQLLPELTEGEDLNLLDLKGEQHFTEPPPRFNDASLIKKLEELGIGRPSTYAPTLSTIQDRFYVEKRERKFFPTPLGMAVTEFLLKNFSDIIDYSFTAQMEDSLDQIADEGKEWKPIIGKFYEPFAKKLEEVGESADRVKIAAEEIDKACPECSKPLVLKFGRYGKFLACSGFPECMHTEPFEEFLNIKCELDGGDIVLRKTKTGKPFYGCKNYPNCTFASWNKPKTGEVVPNPVK